MHRINGQCKDTTIQYNDFTTVKIKLISFLNCKYAQNSKEFPGFLTSMGDNEFSYPLNYKVENFGIGIYKFGHLSPHRSQFLLFVYKDYSRIVEDYSFENIMSELLLFCRTYKKSDKAKERLLANIFNWLWLR